MFYRLWKVPPKMLPERLVHNWRIGPNQRGGGGGGGGGGVHFPMLLELRGRLYQR